MNDKNEYITVTQMLEYMQSHPKSLNMYNDMTIHRQTLLDPVQHSKIFIGRFLCEFEPLTGENFAITCKALRIFHMPLTKKTVDLMSSRYERRILPDRCDLPAGTNLSYLYFGGATEPIGYWYFDERTGLRRAYLYHVSSDKSFILKFDCDFKFLIDDYGLEHCVSEAYVAKKIAELTAPPKPEAEKKPGIVYRVVQKIKDFASKKGNSNNV